jgi:hypothetical protein
MDGSGPWNQNVSGSFTLDSTQTRFPCRVTVSFWRNQYGVGVQSIPPPSTALTFQGVFVTVSSGAVVVGDRFIVPADGEVQIETVSIPLVAGGGDQSENIPRFFDGSISIAPQCESASFSIRARIEWNTQRRQHVLYGIVRECYEEGTPCATFCSGSAPPNVVYLTISNARNSSGPIDESFEATYVLDRVPGFCNFYSTPWPDTCSDWFPVFGPRQASITLDPRSFYGARHDTIGGGACIGNWVEKINSSTPWNFCATGVIATGTDGSWGVEGVTGGAFDWKIEV